jgi:hypothetical protein
LHFFSVYFAVSCSYAVCKVLVFVLSIQKGLPADLRIKVKCLDTEHGFEGS